MIDPEVQHELDLIEYREWVEEQCYDEHDLAEAYHEANQERRSAVMLGYTSPAICAGPGGVSSDPVDECGSRGPRIGSSGVPVCRLDAGHEGAHRPHSDDGWGDMQWKDIPSNVEAR